jgi:uncharacterized damage-inducible protein DinB
MSRDRVENYRRWFAYERDSHRRVLASLETVPSDLPENPSYQRALSIMGHVIAARQMWLFRFGVSPNRPASLFPTGVSFADLSGQLEAMEQSWADYLDKLTDEELGRAFEYQSLDAGWFRSVIEDILTQLFGHSWYHRGQIAMLVKSSGGEPAITDFVFWSRESIPAPTA